MDDTLTELATGEEMGAYEQAFKPVVATVAALRLRVGSAEQALDLAERISETMWKMSREFRQALDPAEPEPARALDAAYCFRLQGELMATLKAAYELTTGTSAADVYCFWPFDEKLRHRAQGRLAA